MKLIVDGVLRFRALVLAISALLIYFGLVRLEQMPLDVLPEFNPPIVEIQTEAPGLSANEVEIMVSFGVEELVSGLPWVKTLKSQSVTGLSTVRLEFEPGTDLMRARQLVQERMTTSFLLPNVAKPPVMQQPISSTNRLMMIALTSKELDLIKLSTITIWTVKPRLLGVPGVANVSVWGERRRQIQVQMDPERMRANGIRQHQVIASTGDALWMSPLSFLKSSVPGTGGWVDTPNQRLEIRHVLPMSSPADIAAIGIDGTRLKLGDVARVVEGHPPLIGDAVVPEGSGLLLVIEKFPGADTVAVTRAVEEAMSGLKSGLQGIDVDLRAFRPATFVEGALANVSQAAQIAIAVALLAAGALLLQWRAPVIGLLALALSLAAAVVVLHWRGAGLNVLVLAGFGAALACMIDDVVVAVSSLAQGAGAGSATPAGVREAALALRGPLLSALLIGVLTVMPVALMHGMEAALLQPVALAYALALAASFLVAVTAVPALAALLPAPKAAPQADARSAPRGGGALGGLVSAALGAPALAAATIMALAAVVVVLSPQLARVLSGPTVLLPPLKEQDLVVHYEAPVGTAHAEVLRQSTKLQQELRAVPGVRSVYGHVGRAIGGDQVVNMNSSRIWISINSRADYAATVAAIRRIVESHPEADRRIRTFLGDRLGLEGGRSGEATVRIYGHQIQELRGLAAQVSERLRRIDGVGPVRIEDHQEEEQLHVTVDLEAAGRLGLKPGDVRRAAATLFSGLEVGRIFEAQKVYEVVVWSTPETRRDADSLAQALIELPNGGHVRLGEVAKVAIKPLPALIRREGVSLYLDVVAGIASHRRPAAAIAEIDDAVRGIRYPLGYHPAVLTQAGEAGARQTRSGVAALVCAALMLLLIQATLRSWKLGVAVFAVLPLSIAGGLLAAVLLGTTSLGVLCGLVGVYALAARLALATLAHVQALAEQPGATHGPQLVAEGIAQRLPVALITLASTALAMLPFLLARAQPGLEVFHPMAVVVLGGLASTALLVLVVLPALYLRYGADREARMEAAL